MVPTPYLTGSTQHSSDETLAAYWFSDMPPFVVPAPPQPHCALFLETPMQIFPTQIPYDATQSVVQDTYPLLGHVQDSHAPPWDAIAPFDNSVRNRTLHSLPTPLYWEFPVSQTHMAQLNESSDRDFMGVATTWPFDVIPAVSQSIPCPPPIPTLASRWVKVPQRPYTHGDRQWDFEPSEPIFFSVNGFPGMNMGDALRKQFAGLDGRDDQMFRNTAKTVSCRFSFPGYSSHSAQISTLGWAKDCVPINRSNLAYAVAKQLSRYLESMAGYIMDRCID